jgi:tetratricopeptide (TPR) repeat protein
LGGIPSETDPQIEETFIVPYERNPHFVGREKLLPALKQKFMDEIPGKHNHRIALHGIGGGGKTQCALEYAYSNKDFYERVYWISAVDQTSLFSGFQNIAKKAKMLVPKAGTPTEIAEAVLSALKRKSKWLIVYDNLDDFKIVSRLLPSCGSEPHHVLITTRNQFTSQIPAEPFEIPVFDEDDSVEFLLSQTHLTTGNEPSDTLRHQAEEIVRELGYLPLAINQAAAFVREVTGDLSTYLEQYKSNRKEVHEWVVSGNQEYPYSVATTWSMCFQVLKQAHPRALRLLQLFSILNPDGIQLKFLRAGAHALQSELGSLILDLVQLAKSLIELEKASLIRWERVQNSVSIHRLLQKVIKDEMKEAELKAVANEFLDICWDAFPDEWDYDAYSVCREYSVQVRKSLIDPTLSVVLRSTKYADALRRVGRFLLDDGKAKDSETLLDVAWEIQSEILGPEHSETLITMSWITNTYYGQGKWTEAARLLGITLEKMKRILGDNHRQTLAAMKDLAFMYYTQGELIEAAQLSEIALEKSKHTFGDDDPLTTAIMDHLALVYCRQGRLTDAARLGEIVLDKTKQFYGDEHPYTSSAMGNLALTYYEQGMLTESTRLEEIVLEKWERILGDEHPYTLNAMESLAMMYEKQGKLTEATRLLEIALEKRMHIFGDEHPDTLSIMWRLASAYHQQERLTEAGRLGEIALEKMKQILEDERPISLVAIVSLTYYVDQEKCTEAARFGEIALEKAKSIHGDEHPTTLSVMNSLASIYYKQGKWAEGGRLDEIVLEKKSDEHPQTLATMDSLARAYHKQGKLTEAAQLLEIISEKRKRILGDEHVDTLATISQLAFVNETRK